MKKSQFVAAAVVALLVGAGAAAFAQDRLATSAAKPVVDGIVKSGEYAWSHDFDHQMVLYATRTADTLYFAAVGNTTGWVSFGLGSKKMDGSDIFIGFVDKDGKGSFKALLGKGHRHGEAPADVSSAVSSYALKQTGGTTTLEVALKADEFIKKGQSTLEVIVAISSQASFTSYHGYRGAITLALGQ